MTRQDQYRDLMTPDKDQDEDLKSQDRYQDIMGLNSPETRLCLEN